MYQMLRIGSYLHLFVFLSIGNYLYAKPSEFINAIELGFSEKGPNINLIKNISDKNQITFGLHYFEGNISSFGYSLIEPVPILFSSKGIQFSFKHFLNKSSKKSRLFAQIGLDLSSLRASSVIDLSSQIYDFDNLTMTCRTCGEITINTTNDFELIPSFLFGWEKKINDNFAFTLAAGVQFFNFSDVEWASANNINFPSYVKQKLDLITKHSNQELDSYGNIIPTLKLSTTFSF